MRLGFLLSEITYCAPAGLPIIQHPHIVLGIHVLQRFPTEDYVRPRQHIEHHVHRQEFPRWELLAEALNFARHDVDASVLDAVLVEKGKERPHPGQVSARRVDETLDAILDHGLLDTPPDLGGRVERAPRARARERAVVLIIIVPPSARIIDVLEHALTLLYLPSSLVSGQGYLIGTVAAKLTSSLLSISSQVKWRSLSTRSMWCFW